jgi:hypothetical protein
VADSNKKWLKHVRTAILVLAIPAVAIVLEVSLFEKSARLTQDLLKVNVSQVHVAMGNDQAPPTDEVTPGKGATYVRVTLEGVPIGERLPMRAQWIQPDGGVYHEINWHTKETLSSTCQTQGRSEIDPGAPAGVWQVKLYLGDRFIGSKPFNIR